MTYTELLTHESDISDTIIIQYFFNEKFLNKRLNNIPEFVKEYLTNRYCDSESYKETILRIKHNITIRPVCPNCGKQVLFIGKESKLYQKFCSPSCVSKFTAKLNEMRYGTRSTLTLTNVKEKTKHTLIKKYGVEHNWASIEVRKKCIETCKEKYGESYAKDNVIKAKNTCLEKYGNINYRNIDKAKETFIKKYGVEHPLLVNDIHTGIQQKRQNTLKNNKSWNSSKIEIDICKYLDEHNIDYIYQYKSDEYPFLCDFYFPFKKLYLEIQGSWVHGFKPYENTKEDNIIVDKWRAKQTKYYNNAINIWTIRDVNKRSIAKENNLNYLEIFSNNINTCVTIIENALC